MRPTRWLPRHLPALDGLRAVAIALVIAFHLSLGGHPLLRGGFLGVTMFFVLSGFLITSVLLREMADGTTIRFGRFLLRRFLRLGPAMLALLLGTLCLALALPDEPYARPTLQALPAAATYLGNVAIITFQPNMGLLAHTWSLALEEQFYLIWPLVLVLFRRKLTTGPKIVLATFALACAFSIGRALAVLAGFGGSSLEADAILYGCASALAYHFLPGFDRLVRSASVSLLCLVGAALLAASCVLGSNSASWLLVGGIPFISIALALAIGRTAVTGRSFWLLETSLITALGRISYGVYLWHLPIAVVLEHTRLPAAVAWPLVVGGSVLAAAASRRWIESPALRLRDRWTEGERSSRGAGAAPPA